MSYFLYRNAGRLPEEDIQRFNGGKAKIIVGSIAAAAFLVVLFLLYAIVA